MASHNNDQNAPDIHTSYPGHIYNFNPADQSCEVQLAIESVFIGYANAYELKTKDRLLKVPVQFPGDGVWSLTHEVPDGTPCYVHFSQRGIDHWLAENKSSAGLVGGLPAPAFSQLFSHNAAVCTVGTQPFTKSIKNFLNEGLELRNGDRSQRVSLRRNGNIEVVTGAATITLKKDSEITVDVTSQATIKAPTITLDGDVTVTKTLTVNQAITGQATLELTGKATMQGDMDVTGTLKAGGKVVNIHVHANPEGGKVGPME